MTETIKPATELVVAALIDDGLALAFGQTDRVLPSSGEFRLNGQPGGTLHACTWPRAEGGHWLLAAVEGPEVMRLGGPATVNSPNKRVRYEIGMPRPGLDYAPLLAEAAAHIERQPALVSFLQSVLNANPTPRRTAALSAFLERAAALDGYLELFGQADGVLVLQGWSMHLETGPVELMLETDVLATAAATIACYDRPDLGGAGRGIVALMPNAPVDMRAIRRAYLRTGETWRRMDVFENRRFLSEEETAGHMAAVRSVLRYDPAAARLVKRLSAPRFQGAETISTLPLPVRAAIDLAVGAPDAGIFLTGWLLDPQRRVVAVNLRNNKGFGRRIDETWHRSDRRDVSDGYGRDPLFAGIIMAGDDAHGFLVSVPCDADPAAQWYLEIVLEDDQTAFLPLAVAEPSPALLHRMLTSIDVRGAGAHAVIATQLGPMVGAVAARLPARKRAHVACAFGRSERKPRITAVIPVPAGMPDIDVTLARFAVDPELVNVEILAVAPAASAQVLGASLQRAARFYGLYGKLVVSPEEMDVCEALEVGASHANGELLLFLSPGVLPRRKGWLSQLGKPLLAIEGGGAVCPTLMWEDESIKFAGQRAGKKMAPLADRHGLVRFAGYARHWLPDEGSAPVAVQAGTVECCLIPKRVFTALGGFARDFVGPDWKGPDFFLRLRAAGYACLWIPSVEMMALDDPSEAREPEYWRQTGRLVDEWGFDRKWVAAPAATTPSATDRM
ncbi:MAG: glycosyltransferase family 2 protein [Solirubrobacterales bacterium]